MIQRLAYIRWRRGYDVSQPVLRRWTSLMQRASAYKEHYICGGIMYTIRENRRVWELGI